ncbi:MAG: UDP-glucose 4-epimerase GalE [Proteobacteria bacterium]|nr:UDP-glucose 4-epimerase GalE [Pseudomonadota bacterium]MBU1714538.1 UDP-glucose 4-epimerase GalE [Pseudomonadota bacterium]
MRILVCGGAGYIGAHMCKILAENGFAVTVFDNLSTGFKKNVRWGKLICGDLLDQAAIDTCLNQEPFDAVMHFSALAIVSDSITQPGKYYENNVTGTLNLLSAMARHGVDKFIFSSTAAVYGSPETTTITEETTVNPATPYGASKWMAERILKDFEIAHKIRSVIFRYFNAAGAEPAGQIGEDHDPETHLIPNILQSLNGKDNNKLNIFGNDYPTPDGTCIRDYIHVNDICQAHLSALTYLQNGGQSDCFNIGNGNGFSILEVIAAVERVTGKKVEYEIKARREGDPAILVANSDKLKQRLNWQPEFTELDQIIETAWRYYCR